MRRVLYSHKLPGICQTSTPLKKFLTFQGSPQRHYYQGKGLMGEHQAAPPLCVFSSSAVNIFRKCFVPNLEHAAQEKELEDLLPTLVPSILIRLLMN